MSTFWSSLIAGVVAGSANLLGGLVILRQKETSSSYLKYFIALGAGFLLAAAVLRMIPASIELTHWAPAFVLLGYFLIHFFEHTIAPHFHFGEETHPEAMLLHHTVWASAVFGLTMHTFFDGISIASGFLVNPTLGILIFLAIILHKIPEGFTIASLTLASGKSKQTAFRAALVLGLATVLGVLLMSVVSFLVSFGLALSAGASIYVAASDLMPEVNKEKGVKMSFVAIIGVVLFFATEYLLGALGVE